jgi:hypothetical protein
VLLASWLHAPAYILCLLCGDVYSAAICRHGVELCVLLFCIDYIQNIQRRIQILEIKQHFVNLFILLLRAIKMKFFQGCSYVYLFGLCVLFALCSVYFRRSAVCLACVVR